MSVLQAKPEHLGTSRVLRSRGGRLTIRYRTRAVTATAAVALVAVAVTVVALTVGRFDMSLADLWQTLTGNGTAGQENVLYAQRMPRAVTALLVGAALGASGAIFQSMTRNPLGSPDIIGFTMGASTGAVVVLLLLDGGRGGTVAGALIGGVVVSVLVYVLSYRKGVQGYRLILVGIGVTAILGAVVSYVLLKADLVQAQGAYAWLVGSLNGRGWDHAIPVGLAVLVLLPASMAMTPRLRMLEMGDDPAHALGVRVESSRRWLLALGTALCAVAVSAAGPIAFVSLAAPQLMRRLTGGMIGIFSSAVMGSLLLIASDVVAQHGIPGHPLPVGVTTVCIGGLYLVWLLARESRANRI